MFKPSNVLKQTKNYIAFRKESDAIKFLKRLQSIDSKYSRTNYYRKGNTVYRQKLEQVV